MILMPEKVRLLSLLFQCLLVSYCLPFEFKPKYCDDSNSMPQVERLQSDANDILVKLENMDYSRRSSRPRFD